MTADAESRIAVSLLTGFLGSGKTSLLKRLLAQPDLAGTAVLINEFGEVGLDHLLVEAVDEAVVLLKSGCVCCTIRGDLRDGLGRLHGRMQRRQIPPFSRVVIETTGLADPVPIVASFRADLALRHHFRLGNVVTVVDALNGRANLARFDEAVRQAALADRLVLSKLDLATPAEVAEVIRELRALNPMAALHPSTADDPAPASLLLEIGQDQPGLDLPEQGHDHHHAIATFCLTAEQPLDWAAFGIWLSMLLNRHGANILRVKGLLQVQGIAQPVVIQGVQHLMHEPRHLDRWPPGPRETRLVVIGKALDRAAIEASFRAFCRIGRP